MCPYICPYNSIRTQRTTGTENEEALNGREGELRKDNAQIAALLHWSSHVILYCCSDCHFHPNHSLPANQSRNQWTQKFKTFTWLYSDFVSKQFGGHYKVPTKISWKKNSCRNEFKVWRTEQHQPFIRNVLPLELDTIWHIHGRATHCYQVEQRWGRTTEPEKWENNEK